MAENTTKFCSLKLFVDKTSHKVLFAEAGKEFVDFLFVLLSVPVGSVMEIAGKEVMAESCLGSVYDSVQGFCNANLLPHFQNNKKLILSPTVLLCKPEEGPGGYVKGDMMYMVLDDLTVKPMHTLAVVDIVNKLKIEDVSNVEELVIDVGSQEFSELLCASGESKTILTDVFLNNGNNSEEQMSEGGEEQAKQDDEEKQE